jgi:hypothetical protein
MPLLLRRSRLTRFEIVFDYGVNGAQTVPPIDLLAFRISPATVGNAHLVDPATCLGELSNNFGFDTKAILFDLNRFDKRSSEGFVARLHVGQVEVRKHIGKEGQKLVGDHMPEKKDAMRSTTHEPGAQNRVRFA